MKKSMKNLTLNKKSISTINAFGGADNPVSHLCTVRETYWNICDLKKTRLTCPCANS
ncbi:MAG: hypothetical protein AAF611_21080 [Bacteroidota bacterium]